MRLRLLIATALCSLLLSPILIAGPKPDDPWPWELEAEFTGYDSPGADLFGYSVALDGDTALIGQYGEEWGGSTFGAAYVYVNSGSGWSQQARLTPNAPVDGAWFGRAVALQGDTALIGAMQDHDAQGIRTGAAYVFTRSAGVWNQAAKLLAPDGEAYDYFGQSVALGGNVALIGAPKDDGTAGDRQGSAYVFISSGTSWTLLQKLEPSDPQLLGFFGDSVALSATTALIGSPWAAGNHSESGAAYVFTKFGGTWHEQAKLHASDGGFRDRFGRSVALQGDRALIGAPHDLPPRIGAAYVFERSGSSWVETQKLLASDGSDFDLFGQTVALDDTTAMASTSGIFHLADPGEVYVFHLEAGLWTEVQSLTSPTADLFGNGLALQGNQALVGDPYDSPGKAYFFKRPADVGIGYCFGDPGVDTPCPCGNDNDGSVPGSGCDNGTFASGAQLTGWGNPSVAADELFLRTTHAEPINSGIYFQGSRRVNGGAGAVFGDGLRCAGGQVVRLQVTLSDAEGTTRTTVPIAAKGGVSPGDIRGYQYWYRTTLYPPCGLWVNEFNLSNGYAITWVP